MRRLLAFLALAFAAAVPAQAAILTTIIKGTFSGTIDSGVYKEIYYGGSTQAFDLAGGSFAASFDIDEQFGPYEGGMSATTLSHRGDGVCCEAYTETKAGNGLVTIKASFYSLSNAGGQLVLIADVVNGALINWRGSASMGSLLGNDGYTDTQAQFSKLTFSGMYFGQVPEPASWALMILGFGLAGGLLRRQARAMPLAA